MEQSINFFIYKIVDQLGNFYGVVANDPNDWIHLPDLMFEAEAYHLKQMALENRFSYTETYNKLHPDGRVETLRMLSF